MMLKFRVLCLGLCVAMAGCVTELSSSGPVETTVRADAGPAGSGNTSSSSSGIEDLVTVDSVWVTVQEPLNKYSVFDDADTVFNVIDAFKFQRSLMNVDSMIVLYPSGVSENARAAGAVNFYDAVLFANAYSKSKGLDTAFRYTSRNTDNGELVGLQVSLTVRAYRLPTEAEWYLLSNSEVFGSVTRVPTATQKEWILDDFDDYYALLPYRNPVNWFAVTTNKVVHSWNDDLRYSISPLSYKLDRGFRLVLPL